MSKKGKGKSREQSKPSQKRRVAVHPPTKSDSWDTHDSASFWDWVSLTDSSASKAIPTFTQDGRCVLISVQRISLIYMKS